MGAVFSVHEAKTHLSKLLQRVRDGETIYIGAYGRPEAILAPAPEAEPIPIGIWADRRVPGFDYGSDDLIGPDGDIIADFDDAIDRP